MTSAEPILPRVLVCHSGRQHSHHLAMALAERGMLAKYVTGLPTRSDAGGRFMSPLMRKWAEKHAIPIDPGLVAHLFIDPVVRRASQMLGLKSSRIAGYLADTFFDRLACRLVRKLRPDVVVAYETGALFTFRRAKQLGIKTVLDAASIHHRWQDQFIAPAEGNQWHQRVTQRKDAEILLADHVLAVSELARESYLDAGISHDRVHAVPIGVDSTRFQPNDRGANAGGRADRDFRFVYVGNASRLKGIDVLCEAVGRLRAAGEPLTMTIIGPSAASLVTEPCDGIVRKGWMSHEMLAAELPQHDVLVLPSFFDSFGMVVAEAMASGLPAIVTQNVGAREMISPGGNGLIIPAGDAVALAEAMRWFIAHQGNLSQMSRASRESAERYDWANYRRRVTEFFSSI